MSQITEAPWSGWQWHHVWVSSQSSLLLAHDQPYICKEPYTHSHTHIQTNTYACKPQCQGSTGRRSAGSRKPLAAHLLVGIYRENFTYWAIDTFLASYFLALSNQGLKQSSHSTLSHRPIVSLKAKNWPILYSLKWKSNHYAFAFTWLHVHCGLWRTGDNSSI